MEKYLESLRRENNKTVCFQIVEDNARLHVPTHVDRSTLSNRQIPLRRHHSQPILRKRCDKKCKGTDRWNCESSAPLQCPKRCANVGDRWRVARNNSDSKIHSPPKRRFTSPSSPMLMLASLKSKALRSGATEGGLPSGLPLESTGATLSESVPELHSAGDQPEDDSSTTLKECTWSPDQNDEFVALVREVETQSSPRSQKRQTVEEDPTRLNSFFGWPDIVLLWSLWSIISQFVSGIILRCTNDKRPGLQTSDRQKAERMEQGLPEESRSFSLVQPPQSPPFSSWEPYSVSIF